MRAPQTKQTPSEVRKDISKREKKGRVFGRALGTCKVNRSKRNPGNGLNKNYSPNLRGFSSVSTHVVHAENAEGNMAHIPITSRIFDRDWVDYHQFGPDERKVRRMKNKQRRLLRDRRNRRKHGRGTHVAG